MRDVFWVEERVREVDGKNSLGWKEDGKKEKITEHITHKMSYKDLLMSRSGTGKFVLPAHVGNGKSIWLSEFAKRVMLDHPEYQVYFFEGSDFNGSKKENRMRLLKEQLEGASDKSIVFVDAIDEIHDDTMKQEIKKFLETTKGRVIVTGRPSEYNDKENHGFTTLQVRPISKEDFIHSRIGDEKKGREVLRILKTSNLSQEVEGNPLLLNFVCILANLSSTEQAKYQDFGIKSLGDMGNKDLENIIRNKSDLYESITRLIVYRHNEGKGIYLSKEELNAAMRELTQAAYDLFKGENLDISSKYLQKLSILFKKGESGEYQFIHKSFQEFFLAQYLTKQPKGNKEIYRMRDENEKNWNVWRDFKSVVLFYGEMLSNNKEEDKLADLLKGLLKNDDIFGEGFFMGLELLYGCQRNGVKNIKIEKVRKKYLDIIREWDKGDLINKIIKFQEFQKRINYEDNEFAEAFLDNFVKNFNTFHHYKEILRFGTKKAFDLVTNIDKGEFSCIDHRVYLELAALGDEKFFELLLKRAGELMETEDIDEAGDIYLELARLGSKDAINGALRCAQIYLNCKMTIMDGQELGSIIIGDIDEAGNIYEELAKLGNKDGIKGVIFCAGEFVKNDKLEKAGGILFGLVKRGNKKAMYFYTKIIERLIKIEKEKGKGKDSSISNGIFDFGDEDFSSKALEVYLGLARSGSEMAMRQALVGARKLMEDYEFEEAGEVYVELLKLGYRDAIEGAILCAGRLMVYSYSYQALEIYSELILLGDNKMTQEVGDYILEFFEKGYIWDNLMICLGLIGFGYTSNIKRAIFYAGKLEEERGFKSVLESYLKLAQLGEKSAIKKIQDYALELFNKGEFEEAGGINLELAKMGDELGARQALMCASQITEKKYPQMMQVSCYFNRAQEIYEELAKIGNKEAIKQVHLHIYNKFLKKGIFTAAGYRYLTLLGDGSNRSFAQQALLCAGELVKEGNFNSDDLASDGHENMYVTLEIYYHCIRFGNKRDIENALIFTKRLIDLGGFNSRIREICFELMKTGDRKVIGEMGKLAGEFFKKGNLHLASDIYIELAKLGDNLGIKGAISCVLEFLKESKFGVAQEIYIELAKIGIIIIDIQEILKFERPFRINELGVFQNFEHIYNELQKSNLKLAKKSRISSLLYR